MARRSDPEYGETLQELMKDPKDQDPRKGFGGVRRHAEPEPGTPEYLRRRDREGAADLENAPRRGR